MSIVAPPLTLPEAGFQSVYDTLLTIPQVAATFGDRIINKQVAPELTDYPFLLHYNEPGGDGYGGTLATGRPPESWRGRYVIRLECEGESPDPVLPALYAIQQRFVSGWPLVSPDGYCVSVTPLEPWPQTLGVGSIEEGGTFYTVIGDFYTLEVLNLGA